MKNNTTKRFTTNQLSIILSGLLISLSQTLFGFSGSESKNYAFYLFVLSLVFSISSITFATMKKMKLALVLLLVSILMGLISVLLKLNVF